MFPVLLKHGSFNKHASLGSSSCGFVSRMLFSKLVFFFFSNLKVTGFESPHRSDLLLGFRNMHVCKTPKFPRTENMGSGVFLPVSGQRQLKSYSTVSSKASPKTVFKNPPSISIQNSLTTALLFFTKQLLKKLTFIQNRWQQLL